MNRIPIAHSLYWFSHKANKVTNVAEKTFTCSVLTPEKAILKTEASFASIPAYDGEIGIMHDRAPLLCRLGIGVVRLDTPEGPKKLFVDAGFAEVDNNNVTLLTEQAGHRGTGRRIDRTSRIGRSPGPQNDFCKRSRNPPTEIDRASAKIKLVSGE